ncbi:MAG: DUF4125 family protein [Proteobacteria bacterium]|nr:DUF4125 family protein [Pseudomonadota bacterium]
MEREELIKSILEIEWEMFTKVQNADERASCQDNKPIFMVMRKAQADTWGMDTLASYLNDLKVAKENQINLMTIKYARMMEITFPEEYEAIKNQLPPVTPKARELVDEIAKYYFKWSIEASGKYPMLFSLGRPITATGSGTGNHSASIDNYLQSELLTYSEATLELFLKDTLEAVDKDVNLSLEILKYTAKSYGFETLEAIEIKLSGN